MSFVTWFGTCTHWGSSHAPVRLQRKQLREPVLVEVSASSAQARSSYDDVKNTRSSRAGISRLNRGYAVRSTEVIPTPPCAPPVHTDSNH